MVPRSRIDAEHHATITDGWLDHLRRASVRFNVGGSGSFVSPRGLVLTNHHVAGDCIAKLASPEHDYLAAGYLAGKDGPEVPCPDLEINQLESMEDTTARVQAARKPGMSEAEANRAMKATMAAIERQCHEETKLRCDVVTFYAGAMYHLYRYRRYTDVRLVFAPEGDIAFFGGDRDNFTFPRYDLDLAIFRIYDGGQPLAVTEWLRWNARGPKEGDVVFTSGHPGRTSRDDTVAELAVLRDVVYPRTLARMGIWRDGLLRWTATGAEAKRQARQALFGVDNSLKALGGYERGLRDPALMRKKEDDELKLQAALSADAALKSKFGGTWTDVSRVQTLYAEMYPRYETLEALGGSLLRLTRTLVRLPDERALPNEQRLPEYRETALDELSMHMFSPAPMYPGVEDAYVTQWMEALQTVLGAHDAAVEQLLAGRTPARTAREIVATTKLYDVNARRALWDGGKAAVAASTDPLVVAMRTLEPAARAVRKRYDDEVEAPMRSFGRRVAEAKFAIRATSVAPDATFTLRLSVGVVRGYVERGRAIAASTDFDGMYNHATGVEPYRLPPRWVGGARARLSPKTPLNFASTNDIIGGNSGSPVVDAQGNLVGLIFDGNLASLPSRFVYDDMTARAISVDTAAMIEALRVVYGADALVDELSSHEERKSP
ncbi:MAG: S46 family peptidase [Myxococcota bacterium]|nr:S46 family peptidase [Myxococcota bacterium]